MKCTCGSAKINSPKHSRWCDINNSSLDITGAVKTEEVYLDHTSPFYTPPRLGSVNINPSIYILTVDRFKQLVDDHVAKFGTNPDRALLSQDDWDNLQKLSSSPIFVQGLASNAFRCWGVTVEPSPNVASGWVQFVDGSGTVGYKV